MGVPEREVSYYPKNNPEEFHASNLNAISRDYSMTFSPTGFVVLMSKLPNRQESEYIEPEPVHSWGPFGEPMVFWRNELVDARSLPEFRGLRKGRKVAGVLPGGGWQVTSADFVDRDSDDEEATLPVVAWIVTEMGTAVPIVHIPTGEAPLHAAVADEAISAGYPARLIPPSSTSDLREAQ